MTARQSGAIKPTTQGTIDWPASNRNAGRNEIGTGGRLRFGINGRLHRNTHKKALEPFLIAETERLEREWLEAVKAENGDLSLLYLASLTAKAGTFGRTISLRRVRKVRVLDRHALLAHYHRDPRFLNDEAVQKLLAKLAEHDLQAGLSVPGAESVEEKVAA